jgi:surface carbohydrate biosynthesis protein
MRFNDFFGDGMSALTPTLYLPIEQTNREFDSKLLIALELLNDGVTVIIGRNPLFVANFTSVPPGAILFKGMNAIPAFVMKQTTAHGHLALATDEEALGLAEIEVLTRSMEPAIGSSCEVFFAQGRRHAEAMAQGIPGAADKIRIVGNARLDLLRTPFKSTYLEEANEHVRVHDDYVMIDTNFGVTNSQWGNVDAMKKIFEHVGYMDFTKSRDREYCERVIKTEQKSIVLIRRVLERLSATFPKITFIVRPHPSERDAPWRKAYGDHPNIFVTAEGSHISWLLGSKLMLHTGSTTGLEAEVLGTPCLTLLPPDHDTLVSSEMLSNHVNERAVGIKQSIELASQILNGGRVEDPAQREARLVALTEHMEALTGRFAYQRIADEIRRCLTPALKTHAAFDWQPTDQKAFVKTREHYEQRLGKKSGTDYVWTKGQIDQPMLLQRLAYLVDATGSKLTPRISEIADGVFRLNG